MMIRAEEIGKEKEHVLRNLLQKYLYEMTLYYGDELNEEGNLEYPYLPYYFTEPERKACFLYDGEKPVGFAMINNHSFVDEPVDHCLAEFTIFPMYRKRYYGLEAVDALVKQYPGVWHLKYSTENGPGAKFWTRVKEKYCGHEVPLDAPEIALIFRSE